MFWHDLPALVLDYSHVTRVRSGWFSITHLETADIHQLCIPLPCNYTVATHVNPLMVGLFVSLYAYTVHIWTWNVNYRIKLISAFAVLGKRYRLNCISGFAQLRQSQLERLLRYWQVWSTIAHILQYMQNWCVAVYVFLLNCEMANC